MNQVSMTSAYMWALVIMVVFFLLAVIISNLIIYKPNDPGTAKRRIWFWTLCVATGVVSFIVNFIIGSGITVPTIQSSFYMHSGIATGVSVVLYIIFGFIVSKLFPKSSLGTWF